MLGAAAIGAVFSSTLARLRRARRARPLRPDRAGRALRRRRLPLRRQAVRLPRAARRDPTAGLPTAARDRRRRRPRAAGRRWHGTTSSGRRPRAPVRASSASRSTTRGTCSSRRAPPACPKCIVHRAGGVLLKHLKEQQLHCDVRAGDRVIYFTTDRLDDVELARRRCWRRAPPPCSTTARRSTRRRTRCSTSPTTNSSRCSASRRSSSTRSAKAGIEPMRHARPPRAAHDLLDRLAALARRVSRGVRPRSSPTCTSPRSRAAPTCAAASCGGDPDRPGVRAARSSGPALGMAVDVVDDDGRRCASPGVPGRARVHARRSRRCRSGSGTTRRRRGTAPRTSTRSPGLGARRLRRRGPSTAAWSSTAAATPRSTPAACASAPPRSTARGGDARGARGARVRPAVGRRRPRSCSSFASPTACRSTDDLVAKIRRAIRAECSPRHMPAGGRRGRRPAAHAEQQAGRARGGRRGERPAGPQHRSAREPGGDRRDRGAPPARRDNEPRQLLASITFRTIG